MLFYYCGTRCNTEYWAVPRHLVGLGHDGGEFGGMSRCCVGNCLSRGLSECRKEGVAASGRANMRGLYVLYLGGLQEARQVADGQFVVSVQPRWGRLRHWLGQLSHPWCIRSAGC